MTARTLMIAAAAAAALAGAATAETELQAALNSGGSALSSDEIAELLVGKAVTARAGSKTFRFYYDAGNQLFGELQGGGWSGAGSYAITDGNQICVSMPKDGGRYRCLTLVRTGGTVRKYNAEGKASFEILAAEDARGL
ncbi:hypothetical protein [Leisingera caerulea]|uniref:Uncharacterized protein n=1 Tax=Leisingera caerulea TaxID=506591 RepID=A0A9Q9HJZ6_LEICA|nr:hypothetical protein [Leisingera caerulea]UWQ55472.1 hypothetical protein K3721_08015 [Leisingera caerulea]